MRVSKMLLHVNSTGNFALLKKNIETLAEITEF